VDHRQRPVSVVCREFGVSRKTAYKWMRIYRRDPLASLADRSRRPAASPGRTSEAAERAVLAVRDEHGWGGRKIHRVLSDAAQATGATSPPPSTRTISAILKRCGRSDASRRSEPPSPPQLFERGAPNELWQLDHMGPREIARRRYHPFTVQDDHSRLCLCFEPLADTSIASYWPVLWDVFDAFGLPDQIMCDGAFAAHGLGLSELEARLIRLGVRPLHGRPYHPQTQGKVERLHGTINRELFRFRARTDRLDHFLADRDRWLATYNYVRPHEALGDRPPVSRWRRSLRRRPAMLPEIVYDDNAVLRKVSQVGDIHFARVRIGVARSLAGQYVRIEEREHEIGVFYAWKELRTIAREQLAGRGHNERI
jgi:transposase InsO family protein